MGRTVLFVSSSSDHAQLLASMLTPLDLDLRIAENLSDVAESLRDASVGVVLTEARLKDADWHLVLRTVHERSPVIQTLVTHSRPDAHFWTDALEAGAYDIITQPLHAAEVQRLILSAWLKFEVLREEGIKMRPSSGTPMVARAAS